MNWLLAFAIVGLVILARKARRKERLPGEWLPPAVQPVNPYQRIGRPL